MEQEFKQTIKQPDLFEMNEKAALSQQTTWLHFVIMNNINFSNGHLFSY